MMIENALERLNFHITRLEWYVADKTQNQGVRDSCDSRASALRTYRNQITRYVEKGNTALAEETAEYVLEYLDQNTREDSYFRKRVCIRGRKPETLRLLSTMIQYPQRNTVCGSTVGRPTVFLLY
jgi:hypothetical protein